MRSYKKILTFIFAFAISFSVFCIRSFAVDHQYVSVSNIWSFAADHSWGVMPYLLGLICDEVCLETDDNKHYAMSYDYKTDDGIFYCVCQYCNEPFKAYVGTGDYGSGIGRGELLYEAYLEYLESSDAPPTISSDDGFYDCTSLLQQGTLLGSSPYYQSGYAYRVAYGGADAAAVPVHAGYNCTINATSSYDIDVAVWCINSSGMDKISSGESLSAGSDLYDTGWMDPGITFTVPADTVAIWLNCRRSNNSALPVSAITSYTLSYDLLSTNDRFGTYMEELDAWNQSNPYLDNPYTPNYYITPDNGDTLCSPIVFSESTKTFTEPVTGAQILCTNWQYFYDPDYFVFDDVGEEHGFLGAYFLFPKDNSYFYDSSPVDLICLIYADSFLRIGYLVEDSSTDAGYRSLGYSDYSYAIVSQTECGVGEHDMTWEVTQDPTCTSTGTETGTCSICGETQTYRLDQLDHIYKSSVTQQATCAGTGVMTYTCTACGNEYTETIAATGVHSYTYETIREPTCGVSGERKYTCSVCGNSYAEDLPPTGDHDWLPSEVDATTYDLPEGISCPDCSGTNFTHVLNGELYDCTCSDCAAEWTVRAVITYGSTTYTCSLCGASYVEQEGEESGLFTSLANFLTDGITWITDKFVELTESLSGIHTAFQNYMEKIRNVGGDFPAMLGAAIACMPEDFMAVLWFTLIVMVAVAVYCKFFK